MAAIPALQGASPYPSSPDDPQPPRPPGAPQRAGSRPAIDPHHDDLIFTLQPQHRAVVLRYLDTVDRDTLQRCAKLRDELLELRQISEAKMSEAQKGKSTTSTPTKPIKDANLELRRTLHLIHVAARLMELSCAEYRHVKVKLAESESSTPPHPSSSRSSAGEGSSGSGSDGTPPLPTAAEQRRWGSFISAAKGGASEVETMAKQFRTASSLLGRRVVAHYPWICHGTAFAKRLVRAARLNPSWALFRAKLNRVLLARVAVERARNLKPCPRQVEQGDLLELIAWTGKTHRRSTTGPNGALLAATDLAAADDVPLGFGLDKFGLLACGADEGGYTCERPDAWMLPAPVAADAPQGRPDEQAAPDADEGAASRPDRPEPGAKRKRAETQLEAVDSGGKRRRLEELTGGEASAAAGQNADGTPRDRAISAPEAAAGKGKQRSSQNPPSLTNSDSQSSPRDDSPFTPDSSGNSSQTEPFPALTVDGSPVDGPAAQTQQNLITL